MLHTHTQFTRSQFLFFAVITSNQVVLVESELKIDFIFLKVDIFLKNTTNCR